MLYFAFFCFFCVKTEVHPVLT
ncbi:hypothetical protein THICB2_500016 [Thiomonas sp. CB2]|nr:hypothetical protein THICB2_500016 [Thiomonas sp. CB2]